MTQEETLAQLESDLRSHFGAWTRFRNDCTEQGATAVENKIAIAKVILRDPASGVARHMYESQRKRELGWSD